MADIGEEILVVFDKRLRETREQAYREQILARDLAIRQTIKELLERRETKAQERARKEAQREAEERAEEFAAALAQDLSGLEEVHVRHRAKLHEAGTPVNSHYRLADIASGVTTPSSVSLPHTTPTKIVLYLNAIPWHRLGRSGPQRKPRDARGWRVPCPKRLALVKAPSSERF